jgi:concentrative nucleoside transporter, CNT family
MLALFLIQTVMAAEEAGNFIPGETTLVNRLVSFCGLFVLVFLAWCLSENRGKVNWRPVIWGCVLQLVLGAIILSPTVSGFFYTVVDGSVKQLLSFAEAGAHFVFGSIEGHTTVVGDVGEFFGARGADPEAARLAGSPGREEIFGIGRVAPPVKTFAFWILPTIVFFSSLMSVLYHLGIMQWIVRAVAWVMVRTMGTSGAESLSAAGNIFVGQTEAPLLIRPFVNNMTRSELMAVMTGGFATVAGGVMGAYVKFLSHIPNIAGHLVMASIMSAPAALAIAKVMVPETEESETAGQVKITFDKTSTNVIEAAGRGANDGMKLALNVAAMLIAIVALVAMFDWFASWIPLSWCTAEGVEGYWRVGDYQCAVDYAREDFSLSMLFGFLFFPIAFIMGVPLSECWVVGELLGEKIVLTEFIAYIHLGDAINASTPVLSQRSAIIASYALCGFANFASIGIQLGGIGGIAPGRMSDLASLGFKAMAAGVIAACMTGTVAGIML